MSQEQEVREAPALCWGSSPLQEDVSEYEACQQYIYFKRLKLLTVVVMEENRTEEKRVEIYYYESPIDTSLSIDKSGIVIREITTFRNQYGSRTQILIKLSFLPIAYTL